MREEEGNQAPSAPHDDGTHGLASASADRPQAHDRYTTWIQRKLTQGSPIAMCAAWTRDMVAAFPELTRVHGHVHLWSGRCPHWWCETPDGEIIDPTVSQFRGLPYAYWPHQEGAPEPTGKCINCGEYVYAPRSSSCSEACDRELQEAYR